MLTNIRAALAALALTPLFLTSAAASTAMTQLPATGSDAVISVFYPSSTPPAPVQRGQFQFQLATDGAPAAGNGRLVIISHGSGGSPWVGVDLAELLVARGFVVAMPQHRGDNYLDTSDPGPDSWTIRPKEVSRAIDRVGADARFHDSLKLDKVGIFGISAGGHTALELAGGSWSPARFAAHCQRATHLRDDFPACVGLITALKDDIFDSAKLWLAERVINHRFADDAMPRHSRDPRIAVAVAAVPFAADFEMESFRHLEIPVGLVISSNDLWLNPKYHDLAVLADCATCTVIATLSSAGHGAMLSPHPESSGLEGALINDPPGFDRSQIQQVNAKVADFLSARLLQ